MGLGFLCRFDMELDSCYYSCLLWFELEGSVRVALYSFDLANLVNSFGSLV